MDQRNSLNPVVIVYGHLTSQFLKMPVRLLVLELLHQVQPDVVLGPEVLLNEAPILQVASLLLQVRYHLLYLLSVLCHEVQLSEFNLCH